MSAMEPIRDLETVNDISRRLSELDTPRGRRLYLLWKVGILTGLRIGDMIQLRVGDLRGRRDFTYLPQKQSHKKRARGTIKHIAQDMTIKMIDSTGTVSAIF